MRSYTVEGFKPVALHLRDVGPFRESLITVDFVDGIAGEELADFFLLLAQNGRGKTTMLLAIEVLFGLLDPAGPKAPLPDWLRDHPDAAMQLDVRFARQEDGRTEAVLLSLVMGAGRNPILYDWDTAERLRRREALGISTWHQFGVTRSISGRLSTIGEDDPVVGELRALIRTSIDMSLGAFEEPSLTAPTLLSFSTYRNIVRPRSDQRTIARPSDWGYRLLRRFELDGDEWMASLDNLLVWYYWLDDGREGGRFDRIRSVINERVFANPVKTLDRIQKDPPQAIVKNGPFEHRLDQLSSGEKSLIQMMIRIGSAMSMNTIVLIDELDLHLHPMWERRIVVTLKKLIRAHPGITVICSSHSMEVLTRFDPKRAEDRLVKGGYIIEEGFPGAPENARREGNRED